MSKELDNLSRKLEAISTRVDSLDTAIDDLVKYSFPGSRDDAKLNGRGSVLSLWNFQNFDP